MNEKMSWLMRWKLKRAIKKIDKMTKKFKEKIEEISKYDKKDREEHMSKLLSIKGEITKAIVGEGENLGLMEMYEIEDEDGNKLDKKEIDKLGMLELSELFENLVSRLKEDSGN